MGSSRPIEASAAGPPRCPARRSRTTRCASTATTTWGSGPDALTQARCLLRESILSLRQAASSVRCSPLLPPGRQPRFGLGALVWPPPPPPGAPALLRAVPAPRLGHPVVPVDPRARQHRRRPLRRGAAALAGVDGGDLPASRRAADRPGAALPALARLAPDLVVRGAHLPGGGAARGGLALAVRPGSWALRGARLPRHHGAPGVRGGPHRLLPVEPVANHLQYLALPGPLAWVASLLAGLRPGRWRRAGAVVMAGVAVAMATSTHLRARAFEDDSTLWAAAASQAPDSLHASWKLAAWRAACSEPDRVGWACHCPARPAPARGSALSGGISSGARP